MRRIVSMLDKDKVAQYRFSICYTSPAFFCLLFQNAIISWETNKIEEAQRLLRDLEKHCTTDSGWLKTMRVKLFGSNQPVKTLAESLEEQIILADSQLCISILTGLTQDIGGLVFVLYSLLVVNEICLVLISFFYSSFVS